MRIAVDAMGGDHAPLVNVDGAIAAAREFGISSLLVGRKAELQPLLELAQQVIERALHLRKPHAGSSKRLASPMSTTSTSSSPMTPLIHTPTTPPSTTSPPAIAMLSAKLSLCSSTWSLLNTYPM